MKKIMFSIVASLMSYFAFGQTKFEISGKYKTQVNGLLQVSHGNGKTDSVPIIDGKFNYIGQMAAPHSVTLFVIFKNIPPDVRTAGFSFFVDSKPTILELDTVTKKSVRFTFLDTKTNFLQKSIFQEKIDLLKEEVKGLDASKEDDKKKGEAIVLANIEKNKSEKEKSILLIWFSKFIAKDKLKAFYGGFSEKTKTSLYGVQIKNVIIPKYTPQIGEMLPLFSQKDVKGNVVNISDLKGKYVLIDFWASWCVPCREENPNLVKAFMKFKDKNFEILGVSLDDKKDKWVAAIKKDGLVWKHVSDLNGWENEVSSMFNIRSVPSSILLDKEGKIIALNLRGEALDKKLEEIFL